MKFAAIALMTTLAAAPSALHAQGRVPIPAETPATLVAGVAVVDTAGASVGTVESVNGPLAVIDTGTHKVSYPVTSITLAPGGAIIALTKAQLDASFVEQRAKAQADLKARLVAGTPVFASDGTTQLGTIKSVDAEFVTIGATRDVRIPIAGFGLAQTGVAIGVTAADFAKAAGGR
ncbi:MAG: hypothetical protein V4537_04895 [Pseudomonadota bacterium]